MAETETNVVLRILREIRGQQVEDGRRLQRVERRVDELHESVVTAMGVAGVAQVATEQHGTGMDEIRDEIAALKRRVQELESRT
jgi:polyhydroxyalkanoate synthesis regulator phasin